MSYVAKNYDNLLEVTGLSQQLLTNHFTLYQGYVTNVNKIAELAESLEPGSPMSSEMRRRFGWEWNGMRLHELYFENLSKTPAKLEDQPKLSKKIVEGYGSIEKFTDDLKNLFSMRGIGWGVVYFDQSTNMIFSNWVNEHDAGHLAGCTPLLVVDVFEHAYILDYGIKRPDYIEAIMKMIDWSIVEKRLTSA